MQALNFFRWMKKRSVVIAVGFLIIGIAFSYIFFQSRNVFLPRSKQGSDNGQYSHPAIQEYVVGGITAVSGIGRKKTDRMIQFLKDTVKEQYLPKRVEIQAMQDSVASGTQYVGTWYSGDKIFYVLMAMPTGSENASYFRAWFLVPGEKIETNAAGAFMRDAFTSLPLKKIDALSCKAVRDPQSGAQQQECGALWPLADGSKQGVSARAPVTITSGHSVVSVAVCFVPSDYAALYPSSQCL